jgi:hypothetical protein
LPLSNDIFSNRYNLVNWFISIQNEINKMNGKNKVVTYDKIITKYLRHKNPKILTITKIGFILVIILLIIKFYYIRKNI